MAFKYEKITDDDRRTRIDNRLALLESRRLDLELDEVSPSTSPAPGMLGVGATDPATGAPIAAGDQKTPIERIDEEIAALRAERDKVK